MNRTLIWDLPTRLFHWLFAGGFIGAAVIALLLGDDSPLFPYHSIIGLTLALMVALRVVWGLVGSRWARFSSFAFGPGAVIAYMKSTLIGGGKRFIGHNPGSACAIFALLLLMLGMAVTGVMLGRGDESVKELHEIMAYAMAAIAGIHILGVALHTVRYKENLTLSMIRGTKDVDISRGIPSHHPLVGAIFLFIMCAWVLGLLRNYDAAAQTTTLPLIGMQLHLGEADGVKGGGGEGVAGRDDDDD